MAEEEDLQSTAGTSDQEQPAGPQFALQRIYLKDSSFESPGSPGVFQGQWTPKINFDIKSKHEKLWKYFFKAKGLSEVKPVLTVNGVKITYKNKILNSIPGKWGSLCDAQ